jgi:hypothetical protein
VKANLNFLFAGDKSRHIVFFIFICCEGDIFTILRNGCAQYRVYRISYLKSSNEYYIMVWGGRGDVLGYTGA